MFGKTILGVIATLGVSSLAFGQGSRNGQQAFLSFEDIAKVMEKLPPVISLISGPDNANWQCVDLDVREHCGDLDGCTVSLHLQNKVDAADTTRGIKEYLYFENATTSAAKGQGLNGYTRQSAGGEYGWITGTAAQYTIFNPWNWAGAYNYRPSFCPGQGGRNSAAHANPYLLTMASNPWINTVVVLED